MSRARAVVVISAVVLLAGGGIAVAGGVGGSRGGARSSAANLAEGSSPRPPVSAGGQAHTVNADPSVSAACPDLGATTGSPSDAGSATHLFTRTTADGVTIRVYRLAATGIDCGPIPVAGGPATLSPSCGVSQQIAIEMSDDTAVGQGDLGWSVASTPSTGSSPSTGAPQTISAGAFGVVEGDPVWWVALQVGAEVTNSKVTFADGSTDEMAPVDGVAVLAHHISVGATSDPDSVTGSVELFDGSGAVLNTLTLPQQQVPVLPVPVLPVPVPSPSPGVNGPGSAANSGSSGAGQAGSTSTTSSGADMSASATPVGSAPDDTTFACPMAPVAGPPSTPSPTEAPSSSSSK